MNHKTENTTQELDIIKRQRDNNDWCCLRRVTTEWGLIAVCKMILAAVTSFYY